MAAAKVVQKLSMVTPTFLPPFKDVKALTEDQLATFYAISEAVLPGYVPDSEKPAPNQIALTNAEYNAKLAELKRVVTDADDASVHAMLAEGVSSLADFKSLVERVFNEYANDETKGNIALILNLLNYLMTGYATPFKDQPIKTRIEILKGWSNSSIGTLKEAAKSLHVIVRNLYIKTSPTLASAIGHPLFYEEGELGKTFDFKFEQFPSGQDEATLQTDVIIIGSGCGSGVAAKNLSEAGHSVIVVEKSYHFKAEHFPMTDLAASAHLYENGQILPSDDGSIAGVFAGSTFGGGGAVNWSASLQTQAFVRNEWAQRGLDFFEASEFQESLDRVCQNMGVHTEHIDHNHGNRVLLEGARRLGYAVKPVPQNTNNKRHYCGYCGHGCRAAEKLGPQNLWFPQAAKGNTRFIEGCEVKEIIFETIQGKKTAVGVRAVWTKRDEKYNQLYTRNVVIKAKKVVVSGGSLWSPLILLKSGINSYWVGRNLHLHPATLVFGVFKERVKPCEGGILTSVVTEFDRLDGPHGVKLEATSMLPSNSLGLLPWNDPLDWKSLILKHGHMNAYISMVRDRDSGRVYPDPRTGRPKIAYTVSDFDKRHALEGIIALAKILFDQGAIEVHTATSGAPPYIRNIDPRLAQDEFKAWQASIRTMGLPFPACTFATAHQMGSCRMGTSPSNSVVDVNGKVWNTEGLYVMDASVFPSASGVNPMITNMAISDANSRKLSKLLAEEK